MLNIGSLFNPWNSAPIRLKGKVGMTYGWNVCTDLTGKARQIHNPAFRTMAKVGACAIDFFTALIWNSAAFLYNNTIARIENRLIDSQNKKMQQKAESKRSWKPTSYKAIVIDVALVSLVCILGYKYFSSTVSIPSQAPEVLHQPILTSPTRPQVPEVLHQPILLRQGAPSPKISSAAGKPSSDLGWRSYYFAFARLLTDGRTIGSLFALGCFLKFRREQADRRREQADLLQEETLRQERTKKIEADLFFATGQKGIMDIRETQDRRKEEAQSFFSWFISADLI